MRVLNGLARLILAGLAIVVFVVVGVVVVVAESVNAGVQWLAGKACGFGAWLVWLSREYLKG